MPWKPQADEPFLVELPGGFFEEMDLAGIVFYNTTLSPLHRALILMYYFGLLLAPL